MPKVFMCGTRKWEADYVREFDLPCWTQSPTSKRTCDLDRPIGCLLWSTARSTVKLWCNELELYDVRYAIGPPVRHVEDWPGVEQVYRKTASRVADGAIVWCAARGAAESVPDNYALAVDPGPKFYPWDYEGRRVWLWGHQLQRGMWERYCELRVVGAEVVGVLLPTLKAVRAGRHIVAGDLRFHPKREWLEKDRMDFSLRRLFSFWEAVGKLYDTKTFETKGEPAILQ